MCVLLIGTVCAHDPIHVCVCVCVRARACELACARSAMLCIKMVVNICVFCFLVYTTDLYNYGYLHTVCFSLGCKAL